MTEQRPAILQRPLASTRCPFCHDEVFNGGIRCGCCGARHHSMCVDEHAACATCGYDLGDQVHRVLLREAEARDSGAWRALLPSQKAWHLTWQCWRRSLTHPVFVGAIAVSGGLTILGYVLERWLA